MRFDSDGWYLTKADDGSNETVKSPMVLHVNKVSDSDFRIAILVGEKHPVSPEHSHSEGSIHLNRDQARQLSEWLSRLVET